MDWEINGKQDVSEMMANSPLSRPVMKDAPRTPVVTQPKKQRGRKLNQDEVMERQALLADYLQQVQVCKKSDIARLFGLSVKNTPSPLTTGLRKKIVKAINYPDAGFNVYGLTDIGLGSCTVQAGRAAELKDVTKQPSHRLGVAKIVSYLMATKDAMPELWPGANDIRYAVNKDKTSFIIGEPLMQSQWRQLTNAKKLLTPYAMKMETHIDWNDWSVGAARNEAYRYVIPPYAYDSNTAQQIGLQQNSKATEIPAAWELADEAAQTRTNKILNYHVPDIAISNYGFRDKALFTGIEFEISAKNELEYTRILKSMCISHGDFIYLTDSGYIENLINKVLSKLNAKGYDTSGIFVYRINNGGTHNWSVSQEIRPGAK